MSKSKWQPEEIETLVNERNGKSIAELAALLNRTKASINSKLKKLRITVSKNWTDAEIDTLIELYHKRKTNTEIAPEVNKTPAAVRGKIRDLLIKGKLHKEKRRIDWTEQELIAVEKLLACSPTAESAAKKYAKVAAKNNWPVRSAKAIKHKMFRSGTSIRDLQTEEGFITQRALGELIGVHGPSTWALWRSQGLPSKSGEFHFYNLDDFIEWALENPLLLIRANPTSKGWTWIWAQMSHYWHTSLCD